MMPIGLLMIEHRLTDRMIALMKEESRRIGEGRVDIRFIGAAVDFFATYADLCHHGKEEEILFRALGGKGISAEHKRIMDELIEEHERARKIVAGLDSARDGYAHGNPDAVAEMRKRIEEMTELYISHIEKEDRRFFIPSMDYFSKVEQSAMLSEMREFDRQLIHKVYRDAVERFERRKTE
jgi:hemerythrin-like domain-containing protein